MISSEHTINEYIHDAPRQKTKNHSAIKIFNCFPPWIKSLSKDIRKFKSALKRVLLEGSFYSIQEYFDWNVLSNPSIGNLPIIIVVEAVDDL